MNYFKLKGIFWIFTALVILTCLGCSTVQPNEVNSLETANMQLVKEMFSQVSEKRDISKIDAYYSQDFMLVSNNDSFNYKVYKKQQADIFKILAKLEVLHYDDMFAKNDKVVANMAIRLTLKNKTTHTFYVMLIAQIKDHKIYRIWEITYPTWSDKLP
jgi:hypothetical protein